MIELTEEELAVWGGFFSTCVGWSMHPGYNRDNVTMPTLHDCAEKADDMIIIRRARQRQGVRNES